jgi:dihydroxy-acid dehydratase
VSSDRARTAEATGARAAAMAKAGGPRPSEILTKHSLRNASVVLQATSGSTNALVHLAAIAGRAGLTYDLAELDAVGRTTPVLLDLKPAGNNFMEDFHAGGGLPALWRRLKDHLDLSARTVSGESLGEVIARWPAYVDDAVIRPLDKPLVKSEAIAILGGNLAPGGAAIKLASATPALFQHEGPAVVFESLEDLERRIDDPNLNVTPQSVMVLRNAGPIGAPGMPEAGALPIPKKLGSQGVKDMVRNRGAARFARGRRRRTAGSGARRRRNPARRQGPPARSQGRRRGTWPPPRAMAAAAKTRARLSAALHRTRDAGRAGLRLRFPDRGEIAPSAATSPSP